MKQLSVAFACVAVSVGLFACGGSKSTAKADAPTGTADSPTGTPDAPPDSASNVTVTVSPATASVTTNGSTTFAATVAGTTNTAVTWSVQEAGGGTITSAGVYTAPGLAGTYHVVATSQADATASGTAAVTVTQLGSGATVSGTIHYNGNKTGRVYINISPQNCNDCGANYGTSLTTAGAYTIRGVQMGSGTYTITAFMDTLGIQQANAAADPAGTASLTWTGSSVTGQDITLTDPTPGTPTAPTSLGGVFSNDAALLLWNNTSNVDHNKLYYMAAGGVPVCPALTTAYGTPTTFIAASGNGKGPNALLRNLTQGTKYCFLVTGVANGAEGPPSAAFGPVTVAAASGTGTYNVTGQITFTVAPNGPLYVAVVQQSAGGGPTAIYFTDIGSPVSPQAYTVTGVPNGTYTVFAFLDQGNVGIFGPNIVGNVGDKTGTPVTVNGANVASLDVTLPGGNAVASVTTQHQKFGGTEQYNLQPEVRGVAKLPVAVTLLAGPNLTSVIDMGLGGGGPGSSLRTYVGLGSTTPSTGQTYEFKVTYSDGTSEILPASITGVIAGLATLTSPAANSTGQPTTPTFAWTLPSGLSASDTVSIEVDPFNGGSSIWRYDMSSTATSVLYNVDGTASQSPLSSTTQYNWQIQITDTNGNQSQASSSFTTQ